MITIGGKIAFGFFESASYGYISDTIEEMSELDMNGVDRNWFLSHIEDLEFGVSSEYVEDVFTGEKIIRGIYEDGPFFFPSDYAKYVRDGRVGIPKEYADYLKQHI